MKHTVFFLLTIIALHLNFVSCKEQQEQKTKIVADGANTQDQIVEEKIVSNEIAAKVQEENTENESSVESVEKEEVASQTKITPVINKAKIKQQKIVKKAKIKFPEKLYEFGEIAEGDIVEHKFLFKNIGNAPLMIKSASATCGCTVPSYPYLELAPGEKGHIGVHYSSVGKSGENSAEITIHTNGDPEIVNLKIHGTVVPK
jgi:hypothetical protein